MDVEIFKAFEASSAAIQKTLNQSSSSDSARKSQISRENYNEAISTFQTLIKAKKNEIAYRKDLISMIEKSKLANDDKLMQSKAAYNATKKSTTPTLIVDQKSSTRTHIVSTTLLPPPRQQHHQDQQQHLYQQQQQQHYHQPTTTAYIPIVKDNTTQQNEAKHKSLDQKVSEFLKSMQDSAQASMSTHN